MYYELLSYSFHWCTKFFNSNAACIFSFKKCNNYCKMVFNCNARIIFVLQNFKIIFITNIFNFPNHQGKYLSFKKCFQTDQIYLFCFSIFTLNELRICFSLSFFITAGTITLTRIIDFPFKDTDKITFPLCTWNPFKDFYKNQI